MAAARELFITGLRNAHGMERQAEEMLERQASRMTDYPELKQKVTEHLGETREQLARLERILGELNESPSMMKDATMAFGANMAAMTHAMASDEVLKNTFANNALENYEIAAYKSLIAMAERAGISSSLLQQSLREEERMADWVARNVEAITVAFLGRQAQAAA